LVLGNEFLDHQQMRGGRFHEDDQNLGLSSESLLSLHNRMKAAAIFASLKLSS